MTGALKKSGVVTVNYREFGTPHSKITDILLDHVHLQKWAIIRHPADWLRSHFAYRWQKEWPYSDKGGPLYDYKTKNFDKFINYVCKHDPPVTEMFQKFIDDDTIIFKVETLNDDLDEIVQIESEFKPELLTFGNVTENHVEMTKEQRQRIWDHEKEFFSKYYVDANPYMSN